MYRRILVPVDGSATSKRGLTHALELAKTLGAHVRVLNVVDERFFVPGAPGFPADTDAVLELMRADGRKALTDARAAAGAAGVPVETDMIESGGRHASEMIVDDIQTSGADLVVMGTHGRRGLNRLLMGSDAERVLHDSPVPVLLVRDEGVWKGSRKSERAGKTR